jgi:glutathione S-transferase
MCSVFGAVCLVSNQQQTEDNSMSLKLYYHSMSRSSGIVWMLEELGLSYELVPVDIHAGEQRTEAHLALNRMGKIPVLVDDGVAISEGAAIGVYLADRYGAGTFAPAIDVAERGVYLRWCFFGPSVVESACMAKASGWKYASGSAGFGDYERVLDTLEEGLALGPWLMGDTFTMADMILGGTLRFMLQFKMIEARPVFTEYVGRLAARPAAIRADEINGVPR